MQYGEITSYWSHNYTHADELIRSATDIVVYKNTSSNDVVINSISFYCGIGAKDAEFDNPQYLKGNGKPIYMKLTTSDNLPVSSQSNTSSNTVTLSKTVSSVDKAPKLSDTQSYTFYFANPIIIHPNSIQSFYLCPVMSDGTFSATYYDKQGDYSFEFVFAKPSQGNYPILISDALSDQSVSPTISIENIDSNATGISFKVTYTNGKNESGNTATIQSSSYVKVGNITMSLPSSGTNMTVRALVPSTQYSIEAKIVTDASSGKNSATDTHTKSTTAFTPPSSPVQSNLSISYVDETSHPSIESTFTIKCSGGSVSGTTTGGDSSDSTGNLSGNSNTFHTYLNPLEYRTTTSGNWISLFSGAINLGTSPNFTLTFDYNENKIELYNGATKLGTYSHNFTDGEQWRFSSYYNRLYVDRFGTNHTYNSSSTYLATSSLLTGTEDRALIWVFDTSSNSWKRGKVYVNTNNGWVRARTIYTDKNGVWTKQNNLK